MEFPQSAMSNGDVAWWISAKHDLVTLSISEILDVEDSSLQSSVHVLSESMFFNDATSNLRSCEIIMGVLNSLIEDIFQDLLSMPYHPSYRERIVFALVHSVVPLLRTMFPDRPENSRMLPAFKRPRLL